jgi:hydroxyethylthiazole kinase
MLKAGKRASELGIPIVLDPVGAGATKLRTESALRLIRELNVAIVRGNSGEIGALLGLEAEVKGVESVKGVEDPAEAVRKAASLWKSVVAITGKRDFVSDGERVLGVDNGHPFLTTITGSGCMATTAIAAFAAVEKDYLLAAAGGLACFGLAAELAAQKASGPASFKVHLFDELFNLTPEALARGARIVQL